MCDKSGHAHMHALSSISYCHCPQQDNGEGGLVLILQDISSILMFFRRLLARFIYSVMVLARGPRLLFRAELQSLHSVMCTQ